MKTFIKQLTRTDIDLIGGKGGVSERVTKELSFDERYYGKDHQTPKQTYTEGNLASGEASRQAAIWMSPRMLRASNQTTASSSCLPERRRYFSALGRNSSLMLVGSI